MDYEPGLETNRVDYSIRVRWIWQVCLGPNFCAQAPCGLHGHSMNNRYQTEPGMRAWCTREPGHKAEKSA